MSRYLIEARHDPRQLACARVVRTFLATGSHYLTHADWGCGDGNHAAWLVVEAASRAEARAVLPPASRGGARITRLGKFSMERIDEILAEHQA